MTLAEIDRELAIRYSQLRPLQVRIEFLHRERDRIASETEAKETDE